MRVSFRQGIITAPPSFLVLQSGNVSLNIAPPAVVTATVADGDADYLITERTTTAGAWTGPFSSSVDYWLYWDIDRRTGVRTFGSTVLNPIEGPTAPTAPANDQHWFDTTTNRMKVWNGTINQWVHKVRVFAARLQSGTVLTSISNDAPAFTGPQISSLATTATRAGAITFDRNGDPIKRSNGTFFTTEDVISTGLSSAAQVRIEAALIEGVSVEPIPAYSIVRFTDFHEIALAGVTTAEDATFGIVETTTPAGDIVNVVMQGNITNPAWNWSGFPVGTPLYIGANGVLTATRTGTQPVVATVLDINTVVLRPSITVITNLLPSVQLRVDENGTQIAASAGSLNFGSGITATTSNGTDVTITVPPSSSPIVVTDDLTPVTSSLTSLNFGANLTATDNGSGVVTVEASVPPSTTIAVRDDGTTVVSSATTLDFGTGLTVSSSSAGVALITAAGGGGVTYDQSLNTTDSVAFADVTTDTVSTPAGSALAINVSQPSPLNTWILVAGDRTADIQDDYPGGIARDTLDNTIFTWGDGNQGTVNLTKLTPTGDRVWDLRLTQSSYDVATFVDVDRSDNSIVVLVVEDSVGGEIVKLTSAGALVWRQRVDFNEDPAAFTNFSHMHVTSTGNVVVAGRVGYIDGVSYRQAFVSVFDSTGALSWVRSIRDTAGDSSAYTTASSSAGDVYLTGYLGATGAAMVVKFSSTGATLWQRTIGVVSPSAVRIVVDPTDIPVIVTSATTQGTIRIIQLNPATGAATARRTLTPQRGTFPSIVGAGFDVDRNLYVVFTAEDPTTSGDFYVVKYTSALDIIWQRRIGGAESEYDVYFFGNTGITVGDTIRFVGGSRSVGGGQLSGGEVIVVSIPTTGLRTGTYGDFSYEPSTHIPAVTNLPTVTAATLTVVTPVDTITAGVTAVAAGPAHEYTLIPIGSATRRWDLTTDGISTTGGVLPASVGSAGSVLTAEGGGRSSWQPAPPQFVFAPAFGSIMIPEIVGGTGVQNNIAIGHEVLQQGSNSSSNVLIGDLVLRQGTDSFANVGIGLNVLANSTGASNSVAIGATAMQGTSGSTGAVAIGSGAMGQSGTGGEDNIAIGRLAGRVLGASNAGVIAIGSEAMTTSGSINIDNIAIGRSAVSAGVDGSNNVYIGSNVGQFAGVIAGSSNVVIGDGAASGATTFSNVVVIGSGASGGNGTNNIVIGSGTTLSSVSNTVRVGNNAITNAEINVAWTVTSDRRDKTEIRPLQNGLSKVLNLQPSVFKLQDRSTGAPTTGDRYGFIAQEVYDTVLVDSRDPEHLKLNETMVIPLLVAAIQQQQDIIDDLKDQIAEIVAQLSK